MSYKYQKQYRLKGWDYGAEGYYFVTICVGDRKNLLGRMVGARVELSAIGLMAEKYWSEIPKHFPGVSLDYFVIMPNHVHGIIAINNKTDNNQEITKQIGSAPVGTQNLAFLQNQYENKFGPQSKNLASIIRGFKIGVKKFCNQNGYSYFIWQPRFHDHIIRDENELNDVRQYIEYNPDKWQWDKENIAGLKK